MSSNHPSLKEKTVKLLKEVDEVSGLQDEYVFTVFFRASYNRIIRRIGFGATVSSYYTAVVRYA